MYAPSIFTIQKNHKSLKNVHYFIKKIAHIFGMENKLNNAEVLSQLMGLGPMHLG